MKIRKAALAMLLASALTLSLASCSGSNDQSNNPSNSQTPSGDNAIELKIQGAWSENDSNNRLVNEFIDKVAEKTNGTVTIQWGGGHEAIPQNQQSEALKNGVIDILWTCHTYMSSHVPVLQGMKLTDATQLRSNGGYDYVASLYADGFNGAKYLGQMCDGLPYALYTKEKVQSIDDFKGLTFRATPAYQAFVEALGSGASNMDPGDAYQALENNVIQGYGWPAVGIKDYAWNEVSKYIISTTFYNTDTCVVVSGKTWDKLSSDQQSALLEVAEELESGTKGYFEQAIEDEWAALVDGGMEILDLPEDVAKEYHQIAYDAAWAGVTATDAENAAVLMSYTDYEAS